MTISIPEHSLVLLVGPSGSGKSVFAQKHFKPTEVLSSDFFRGLIADQEGDQSASGDAFKLLHFITRKRLIRAHLTVIDATNLLAKDRKPYLKLAQEFHFAPVALVFNLPPQLCLERNAARAHRRVPPEVMATQLRRLENTLHYLDGEGFARIYKLSTPDEVNAATVQREALSSDLRHAHGPFDIIGDVHGCYDELAALLGKLGYQIQGCPENPDSVSLRPPAGRKLVFLGDLVDRGPKIPEVLSLVMSAVAAGHALCLPGNHDGKLKRKLRGHPVAVTHGLAESLAQLETRSEEFRRQTADFIDRLPHHYVLDDGKLVVAHAGMKEPMQGRSSAKVRDFALFGETTGETDEFGLPVRLNWAAHYRGRALVVYGHTPVAEPQWLNHTVNIDTGCVFGGKLTALRYPEMELVSAPARAAYAESKRPFLAAK